MAFNSLQALRSAGVLAGDKPQAVEDIFSSLSKEEVEFLISLKSRVAAAVTPEVVAHSADGEEDTPCFAGQTVIIH